MKICHVITGLGSGGAQVALCGILERLRPPQFEHVVVALGSEAALSPRVANAATLHHLGMHADSLKSRDVFRLRRILRAENPDLLHAWMYHANLMATLAARTTPLLWGIHHSLGDIAVEKRKTRAVIRMNAWLSWKPRRILYASAAAASQHENMGFRKGRSVVIPNGYDLDAFAPDETARVRVRGKLDIPADAFVVGMVARVHPTKDHENFLRAAARFLPDHHDAMFVLVGEGASMDNRNLATLIDALRLRAHVRLCGRREDVASLNAAFDIATLSSRSEAFPNAVAEAMACAVPCVATDVGDVAAIIGDAGAIVPPRDPDALNSGWNRLAALGARGRQALGARARQRIVERYKLDSIASRHGNLYRTMTGMT